MRGEQDLKDAIKQNLIDSGCNKKLIIYIVIGLIILALIIAIILINKQNTNRNELETNQNYSNKENIKSNENIQKNIYSNQSIEDVNITTETNSAKTDNATETSIQEQVKEEIKEENIDMIKIKVNSNVLEVKLEDNEATKSLVERLKNGDISVNANEYGGFEKVGNLGFSLPRNDKNITTSAGDIVLYQGNQISLFYNSNSWSYTKLGRVQNVSGAELKNILGSGDVTLVISLD